jgi:ABC-type branched-subunit amino acid transport system substrate-binding protein
MSLRFHSFRPSPRDKKASQLMLKSGRRNSVVGLWVAFIALWGVAFAASTDRLTTQERRGKQIYLTGTSPSGREIIALLGAGDNDAPGSLMACANCHGFDGRGKPEGGVIPSNITWEELTKPYGHTYASGRRRPAYAELSLARAIIEGVDPAGNQLAAAMPKYRMSREDLADLIAYLKRLTDDRDPGITETTVKVGTLLPMTGPLADIGGVAKAVITGYFNDINDGGGIYNRRLELHVADVPDASSIGANAKRLVEDEQVFCLAGAFTAGADDDTFALMKSAETPLVGPFTLFPRVGFPLNRHVFYLFSGLKEQARAFANFLVETKRVKRLAFVYSESRAAEVLEAIEQHCQKAGCSSVAALRYTRGQFDAERTVEGLRRENAEALFLFGLGAEEKTLLKEVEKTGWSPYVILPGSLAGGDVFNLPSSFNGKVLLSFPTLPSDQTEAGLAEYRAFAQKHKLPARHIAVQLSSYCAAKLLAHGMKLAGKDLSREKLIGALERLYNFDTGLTPPITYNANRRIGALGAYVVAVDLEKRSLTPASEWIKLN